MFWVIALILGVICAIIANNKGRSAIGWFFIGFLFGLFALIVICVISDLKKQEAERRSLQAENRRLKERMRKDRMVADQRHRQLNDRLAAHDRVAGIDTSSRQADNEVLNYEEEPEDDGNLARSPGSARPSYGR